MISKLVLGLFATAVFGEVSEPMRRFATGMNGDEDLGEDIIMKNKPFMYQKGETDGDAEDSPNMSKKMLIKKYKKIKKKGDKMMKAMKALKKECDRRRFATGMNGDEDLGEDIIMKNKPFMYSKGDKNEDGMDSKMKLKKMNKAELAALVGNAEAEIKKGKKKLRKLRKRCQN